MVDFFRERFLPIRIFSRTVFTNSDFFATIFYVVDFFRDHFLHGLKIFGTDFA